MVHSPQSSVHVLYWPRPKVVLTVNSAVLELLNCWAVVCWVVSFSWSRRPSVSNLVWWHFPAKMSTYRRAHTRMYQMLDSLSTSLSALATALHHPCFWRSPLLGLVCFMLASKKERACYNPCGGFCRVGYLQITSGICYQLMLGFTLGLHDLYFPNEWTTGWTYPFFYFN